MRQLGAAIPPLVMHYGLSGWTYSAFAGRLATHVIHMLRYWVVRIYVERGVTGFDWFPFLLTNKIRLFGSAFFTAARSPRPSTSSSFSSLSISLEYSPDSLRQRPAPPSLPSQSSVSRVSWKVGRCPSPTSADSASCIPYTMRAFSARWSLAIRRVVCSNPSRGRQVFPTVCIRGLDLQ